MDCRTSNTSFSNIVFTVTPKIIVTLYYAPTNQYRELGQKLKQTDRERHAERGWVHQHTTDTHINMYNMYRMCVCQYILDIDDNTDRDMHRVNLYINQ